MNITNLYFQNSLSGLNFSPEGRLSDIKYAMQTIENSDTAIGLKGKDGVVFAVENQLFSKLYTFDASKRIFKIEHHIGVVDF